MVFNIQDCIIPLINKQVRILCLELDNDITQNVLALYEAK